MKLRSPWQSLHLSVSQTLSAAQGEDAKKHGEGTITARRVLGSHGSSPLDDVAAACRTADVDYKYMQRSFGGGGHCLA